MPIIGDGIVEVVRSESSADRIAEFAGGPDALRDHLNQLVRAVNEIAGKYSIQLNIKRLIPRIPSGSTSSVSCRLATVVSGSGRAYTVNPYNGDNIENVWIDTGVDLPAGCNVGIVAETVTISSTEYSYWGFVLDPYYALYRCE